MTEKELATFKSWFKNFANQYKTTEELINQNIALKIKHTGLVLDNTNQLLDNLHWSANDRLLAQTIALFHDVGRFVQINRYKTFNDRKSFDHAALGVESLLTNQIMADLSGTEQRLILSAITWHNKRCIPQDLPVDETPFVQLIRDADKLDIFRVFAEYYPVRFTQPNKILEFGLPEADSYSEKIARDILDNRLSDLANIKNVNDIRLIKLSWVFDFSFPASKKLFRERNHLESTISALPKIPLTEKIFLHLQNHLAKY